MNVAMKRSGAVIWLRVLAAVALLAPAGARAWWDDGWTGRKQFTIDLSSAGASIDEPVGPAVVLVRLAGNFEKLGEIKEDGGDLRFVAGDDRTPLRFHLEKFDPLLGEALAWVAFPDLQAGGRTSFWIYFGNPNALPAEDMKGTFDPSTVAGVWHFTERDQPARDSSSWGNVAQNAGRPAEGAIIGRGLTLDGTPLALPAGSSLAWSAGGQMTWSLWVKPADEDATGILFSRSEDGRHLRVGLEAGRPFAEVSTAAGPQRVAATTVLPARSWHQVAVTTGAEGLVIWVDGVPEGKVDAPLPALNAVAYLGGTGEPATTPPSTVPRRAKEVAKEAPSATAPFQGEVDELQISKVERSPAFMKLSAVSQGPDPARLLVAGKLEEEGGGPGYLTILLDALTPDGKVVIAILIAMAVISWMVMVGKAQYLGRVERANERFLERFRAAAGGLPRFVEQSREAANDAALLRDSPLHRVFQGSAEEIRKRSDGTTPLHAEAIEAIRATLDAGLVRENLRLQSRMVLLTIAISGGPFLGLLGTVVGVMITFAAIAAAGDVNVNAIAPGIAAALVATVAGLGVAIPALFGYNWLLTRIKNTSAVMHVFVDELVTKIAEAYSERTIAEHRGPHLARAD